MVTQKSNTTATTKAMKKRIRLIVGVFALGLALIIGLVAQHSFAQSPTSVTVSSIRGNGKANCKGKNVPIVFQGDEMRVQLQGFPGNAVVEVNVTRPNGSSFNIQDPTMGVVAFGGRLITPDRFEMDAAGSAYFKYQTDDIWDVGCYTIEAQDRTGSVAGRTAIATIEVVPGITPTPTATSKIAILRSNTDEGFASADQPVEMFGRDFGSGEVITITVTEPDGSRDDPFPDQHTNNAGGFYFEFKFNPDRQTGHYTFTATGATTGFTAQTLFHLKPITTSKTTADMNIVVPPSGKGKQGTEFQFKGQLFDPHANVNIDIQRPDGAMIVPPLPGTSVTTDEMGNFATKITLGKDLPTGDYIFIAKQQPKGELLATTTVTLTP